MTAGSSTSLIIGIAVGVPAVLAIAIAAVLIRIVHVRKVHRKALAELEKGAVGVANEQTQEIARPVNIAGCRGHLTGWDALGSNDTVNEPQAVADPAKRKRATASLPKRIKQSRSLSLKKWKHLSAIAESPRPDLSRNPSGQTEIHLVPAEEQSTLPTPIGQASTTDQAVQWHSEQEMMMTRPESPRPEVLPSFAIRSPSQYGAAIASDENKRIGARSVSVGNLAADGAVFERNDPATGNAKKTRPPMHERSVSLGAPLTRPPSGPVPPLPVISPHTISNDECTRPVINISRTSSSSSCDSAGSSVLVTSPILSRTADDEPLSSPTLEDVVANDSHASLRNVTNRTWQRSRNTATAASRTGSSNSMRIEKPRGSVRGNIVRFSSESLLSQRLSSASTSSTTSESGYKRLSIPQIATADRISISRVSSSNSLTDPGSAVKTITTPPRRQSKRVNSVSVNGSPAQRKQKNGVLRDISGNATKAATSRRQMSISTQDSSTSSNGNPFHWDCSNSSNSLLSKPSALKGSPNARKGHRRQNCVRISTLTPQILGPARSRSSSPAGLVMDEILEERESDEYKRGEEERREVERVVAHERRRTRPPMPYRTTSSESNLRIQTLRASLTPASPELSSWTVYQEAFGLPSQPSDSAMSTSQSVNSQQSEKRQSDHSTFNIPRFPSPNKAKASLAMSKIDTAPMPQFSFGMESPTLGLEDKNYHPWGPQSTSPDEPAPQTPSEASPIDYSPVSPDDMPSSPPLPTSKTREYNPAWPVVTLAAPREEYDPASPPVIWDSEATEAERSSGFFLPFAIKDEDEEVSPRSRPTSYAQKLEQEEGEELPCSPRTIPRPLFAPPEEKLTSANASFIMARLPSNFLGSASNVPILTPPATGNEDLYQTHWQCSPVRRNSITSTPPAAVRQPAVARAPHLPTIPQSDDNPSTPPIPTKSSKRTSETKPALLGPRAAPGKSVLKNIIALRRMNSEAAFSSPATPSRKDDDEYSPQTRYSRLGREASPLLPWIPSTNSLDAEPGETSTYDISPPSQQQNSSPSAVSDLGSIDFDAWGRNIEGALAGFAAEFEANHGYAWSAETTAALNSKRKSVLQRSSAMAGQRNSTVWDDGEKFWTDGGVEVEEEPRTVDPRLLMTPASKLKEEEKGSGTPRSLYDADGFLKA